MLYKRIGKNIRAYRILRQMTQAQLAEAAGISLSFLGHIERGSRKLSVDTLYSIVSVLDCSADEVMGILVDEDKKRHSAREILRQVMELLENEK